MKHLENIKEIFMTWSLVMTLKNDRAYFNFFLSSCSNKCTVMRIKQDTSLKEKSLQIIIKK